jgi:hypothetical protein
VLFKQVDGLGLAVFENLKVPPGEAEHRLVAGPGYDYVDGYGLGVGLEERGLAWSSGSGALCG